MPTSPSTRCPTCQALKSGPCPNGCDSWEFRRPASWPTTEKAKDPRWRKISKERLKIEPLCRFCGGIATQADHLDSTDYEDDSGTGASWLNIFMTRSLCLSCHRTRTALQSAAARRKETA